MNDYLLIERVLSGTEPADKLNAHAVKTARNKAPDGSRSASKKSKCISRISRIVGETFAGIVEA